MKIFKIGRRGGPTSEPAAATDTQPRSNGRTTPRAEAARACNAWTELDPVDLVKRGRFIISATTDDVYTPYAGIVWHRDSDRIEYGYDAALYFTVDRGEVRLFERFGRTWSEMIAAQAGAR